MLGRRSQVGDRPTGYRYSPYASREYAKAALKNVPEWKGGDAEELMSGKEKQTQERVARADLVIADNGHVLTGYFPGDVDPPALPDCCLRVVRRYVHDPASIRAPAGCADGERRSQTDHDQHRNEKISGHGEILPSGLNELPAMVSQRHVAEMRKCRQFAASIVTPHVSLPGASSTRA